MSAPDRKRPRVWPPVLGGLVVVVLVGWAVSALPHTGAPTAASPRTVYVTVPPVTVTVRVPVPAVTTAAPVPVVETRPADTVSEGTYEVGVDVAPGKYKTTGGKSCYWARLRDTAARDIIGNGIGDGPAVVTVRAGELFETARCAPWTKAA